MSITVTTLANGLRVASDRIETVRSVSLGVWVGTGARSETAAENGVAHFLEHMAFKGTARRTARQLADEIEAVGGHMNAYTSRETTAYYVKVMDRDVALGMDILGDIVRNPAFEPEEIARESGVILQEIAQSRDTPDDVVHDHLQELAYPDQPMGRSILGPEEIVASMSRERLIGFMERGYRADAMVVAASGNIDHAALVDLAEQAFGDLPAGDAQASSAPDESARYRGGARYDGRRLEQVQLAFAWEGVGYDSEDHYLQSLLAALFGGGMSSRLFQELRERRGLAYSVYAYAAPCSDSGLFGVSAGVGAAQAGDLALLICDMVKDLPETLTSAEIDRAKAQMTAGTVMATESASARVEQLANQLLLFGRPVSIDEQIARIEAIDQSALADYARRLFERPLSLAAVGPTDRLDSFETLSARLAAPLAA
ncbi:MAG: pitrilysin family protein [Alphaproteobacteria bacterium]|nr:pitrilysin family protein [Alphaproteobacteria bacterium]